MLYALRRVVPCGVVFLVVACGGGGGSGPPAAPPPPNPLYVRTNGNDANTGADPANALRTISKAASLVRSGYKVIVGSGTYREGVTTNRVGATPEGLTFLADTTGEQTGDLAGPVILNGTQTGGAGFNLSNSGGSVIDGFTITNFPDAGIVIKSGSDNMTMQNCVIFGNPGDGIRVQDSRNVLIFNNLIYGNGGSGVALVGPNSGSSDGHVINNTIFADQFRGLTVGTSSTASQRAFVRNNIIQNSTNPQDSSSIKAFTNSDDTFDSNFNLVFPATYVPSHIEGLHDVARDAQFVNAAVGDFHLRSSSPAIDSGFSLTGMEQGLQNILRGRTTTGGNDCDKSALDLGYHYPPETRCTGP
jgi:parallel beta-helix repeat protein